MEGSWLTCPTLRASLSLEFQFLLQVCLPHSTLLIEPLMRRKSFECISGTRTKNDRLRILNNIPMNNNTYSPPFISDPLRFSMPE